MHDLAKWDIPQVWLCLALTFFLSDVYLNMVPRHVEPHSILRSSSVPSSPPHLVSFCHFPLHNSEDSASWAGMCVRLTRSSAQICSIEKEICVSCMIGVGRWTVIGECSVPPGMTLVIIMEYLNWKLSPHTGMEWLSTAYCFFFPVAFMIVYFTRQLKKKKKN